MSAGVQSPVFVGRQAEISQLTALMHRAQRGESAFALVGGEAGVGKTRLAGELVTQATAAGFMVLVGHCIELGAEGLPLAPLVDALRTLARTMAPDELTTMLGPRGRGLARLLPELARPDAAALSAENISPAQLLELVLGLLGRLSAAQPVLLILEDLHWADRSTLELVAFLVRSLREVRVLLVGTFRSDELHRRHPLRPLLTSWERVRSVGRCELRRFDRDQVAAQLAAILASEPAPVMVDLIFDRSGGNAYLVEELAGVMRDGNDPADLPPSLRDVLLSRADSLSTDAQRLLRTASVWGRRVPDQLLAQVAAVTEAELFGSLREAVESHLLVVDQSGHGYEFRHVLTRDAVYEDMLPGERVRLHAAYGGALERDARLAGDEAAVPAALAHHWYAALDLPRALPACVAAASQAMASFAPAEALRHLERALEIWPMVPDAEQRTGLDQIEVTKLAADAAYLAGDVDRSLSLYDQALTDLSGDGDALRRALLMDRRGHALRDIGRETEAIILLKQALALLPADQVTLAHAVVLGSLASSLMRTTDMSSASGFAERAVDAARAVRDRQVEADALISLGLASSYLGSGPEGLEDLRAGLRLAADLDVPAITLRGYVNLSDVLELLGRHEEAAEAASAGIALATTVGMARQLGSYLTGNLVEPLLRLGRWAEADQLCAQALTAQPEGIFAATLLQLRAELAAMSGRYSDAAAEVLAARRALGQTSDMQFVQTVQYSDALAAHGTGDLAAARELVAVGLASVKHSQSARFAWPLLWLAMRIEADQATRTRDRRENSSPQVAERCAELATMAAGLVPLTAPARAYQALIGAEQARAAGVDDEAAWASTVTAWRAAGEPFPLAYALLRLAEVQCTVGSRQAAAATVQEAHAIASQIGAAPVAQEAVALARRARLSLTGPPLPAGPLVSPGSLVSPGPPVSPGPLVSPGPPVFPGPVRPGLGPAQDGAGQVGHGRGSPAAGSGSPSAGSGSPAAGSGSPAAGDVIAELDRFGLTAREREILLLLAAGRSNPQIAQILFISPKTASVHVSNILAKLGVSGRLEAAAVAHRLGVADQDS